MIKDETEKLIDELNEEAEASLAQVLLSEKAITEVTDNSTDIKKAVFTNVSLSTLNKWLSSMSTNEKAESLNIMKQVAEQNKDVIINDAKLTFNGLDDLVIDLNKIVGLSGIEREELYQQYLEEYKVLAGI